MKKKPLIAIGLSLMFALTGVSVVSAKDQRSTLSSLEEKYPSSKYSEKEKARVINVNTENKYEILSKDYFHIEWAKFTVPEDGFINLTLDNLKDELPVWIRIENENGTASFLDTDTSSDYSYIDNRHRSYAAELKAGTYYLCLNNASEIKSNVTVNYNVKYKKKNYNVNKWVTENGNTYFYHDGNKVTGLVQIENNVYLFSQSGEMQIGWQKIGGYWKYFNADGTMKRGWISYNGSWYFLNSDGDMLSGLARINGVIYFFNESGVMQTGWVKRGVWRYFGDSGAMHTGWLKQNGSWYYLDGDGDMVTGFDFINYTWYYFNSDGTLGYTWGQ